MDRKLTIGLYLILFLLQIYLLMRTSLYLTAASALLRPAFAVDPTVKLNYTTYRGVALDNGVTQWLGVRYAAPPLGALRFSAPQPPPKAHGVVDANAFGNICLPTPGGEIKEGTGEDCLFMNVYAPSHATASWRLPVYFFIQGGGFNTNSNANYNGSGLIEASGHNIVVVNFNYRVGPYGFLASKEVQAGGSINNGLKDQRLALQWVQDNIHLFGGDPSHVTIGGDSAGAQSVDLQVTAYGGRNDGLFHATAAESQSFSGLRTVEQNQFAYNNLTIRANCSDAKDSLACLRNLTAAQLQSVNINIPFPGAEEPPLYMYGPTLDYDFISDYTYRAYAQGKFVKVPAIGGDDTNEGTIFVPQNTTTSRNEDTFIKDQFPRITKAELDIFNSYYKFNKSANPYPNSGPAWRATSKGYGEMRYICPGIFISGTQANMSVPNWNYHWNVIDPTSAADGFGVTHTVEVNAIWGPNNTNGGAPDSYYAGGVNAAIVPLTQAYWTSFIRTYNPNTYKLKGAPLWEQWKTGDEYWRRLMFQTNETKMESVPVNQQERCRWLSSIGLSLGQ